MSPNHPMTLMACEALLVVFGLGEENPGFVRYLSKAGGARGRGHDETITLYQDHNWISGNSRNSQVKKLRKKR